MSETLSAKYYHENKERLQNKSSRKISIFLKKKKKASVFVSRKGIFFRVSVSRNNRTFENFLKLE